MQDHHQLEVWQRAMSHAVGVYNFAAELPDVERFNLASQLRRAVAAVPLNIAEGSGSGTEVEFARFLGYAYRSLKEVGTALELCQRLYPALPAHFVTSLIDEGDQIARMIYGLTQRLRAKG